MEKRYQLHVVTKGRRMLDFVAVWSQVQVRQLTTWKRERRKENLTKQTDNRHVMKQRQAAAADRLLHRNEANVTAPAHRRPIQMVVHLIEDLESSANPWVNQVQPADLTAIKVMIRRQTEVETATVDIIGREGLVVVAEILVMGTAVVLILKIRRGATDVENKRNLQTKVKLHRLPTANRSG